MGVGAAELNVYGVVPGSRLRGLPVVAAHELRKPAYLIVAGRFLSGMQREIGGIAGEWLVSFPSH